MGKISGAARCYIALVAVAAVAVLAAAPWPAADRAWWQRLAVLCLLFMICNSTPTPLTARQSAWSPSSCATLAAAVLLGPVGAALAGLVAVFSPRRQRPADRIFNGAMNVLSGYAAGAVFRLGARPGLPDAHHFARLIVPFAAAAIVHVLANHLLIWGVLRLNRAAAQAPGPSRRRRGRAASPTQQARMDSGVMLLLAFDLGYAALGLVIAALWAVTGWFAAVLVLVPLFVARWAMGQFAEQQRAYNATMAALCQAVETKDFYTRGHSERVSRGSGMIARQLGMRPERAEALQFAGMLHDVGKLGVPTKVLRKTGPLTEEEYAAIQLHPMRGLEIVREIGFLNEALNGIMHHHERMDGRGYPMGFAGAEIPEFARIIAVADAFDSMTSTRSYRQARGIEEAVSELRRGVDSQFDPVLVEAFIAALGEEKWQLPVSPPPPARRDTVTAQDHDDPTAPLQVVESA